MSDDAKDDGTPEVKLDAAGGFMPDPPPPSLSPRKRAYRPKVQTVK